MSELGRKVILFVAPVGAVLFLGGAYMTDAWSMAFLDMFAGIACLGRWARDVR